jgi:hypothetical protein
MHLHKRLLSSNASIIFPRSPGRPEVSFLHRPGCDSLIIPGALRSGIAPAALPRALERNGMLNRPYMHVLPCQSISPRHEDTVCTHRSMMGIESCRSIVKVLRPSETDFVMQNVKPQKSQQEE